MTHQPAAATTPPATQPQLLSPEMLEFARTMRTAGDRLLMEHRFAVDEVLTKVNILKEEFLHLHRYNPIEHIGHRVKTMPSILEKVVRKGCEPTAACIKKHISDIAGIRITCSFISDTYHVLEALTAQNDVRVIEIKDYIRTPKPNGYKSLHAIVEIPVYLSTGPVPVKVEVQIRTIAMDFWASLEHKIFYKYRGEVPAHLVDELRDAAATAAQLDARMERLHKEVHSTAEPEDDARLDLDDETFQQLWQLFQQSQDEGASPSGSGASGSRRQI